MYRKGSHAVFSGRIMIGRTRISRTLFLTVAVPIVGTLLLFVLVLISFEASRRVAVEMQKKDIEELVALAGSAIDRLWITPRNQVVTTMSKGQVLRRRINNEASLEELIAYWSSARQILDGYFFIYYGLEDGTVEHYPDHPLPEDFDPRTRPWYKAGMASGGSPVWTAPYTEVITGETIVSTVMPIYPSANGQHDPIGVMAADINFKGLQEILERMKVPTGGAVFLVDQNGQPFIGTGDEMVRQDQLPQKNRQMFIESSAPLSNGWRVSVVAPRRSIAEAFERLRKPIVLSSAILILTVGTIVSVLVGRMAIRARSLARYFKESADEETPLRELFESKDEFSDLNRQFNRVIESARLAEERKLSHERTFRFLVEQAPAGFFRARKNGQILYLNAYCADLLGYALEEILTEPLQIGRLHFNAHDRDRLCRDLDVLGEVRNRKIRLVKKTGAPIWVSITARIDRGDGDTDTPAIEGLIQDISADIEEREKLVTLAETDPLTGASNRRAFDTAMEKAVQGARTMGLSVALVVFDLDGFKAINDSQGHDAGDLLLRHIVTVAAGETRESDFLARLGGDEFAILLHSADEQAAFRLAKRLQEAIQHTALPEKLSTGTTLSIGVSAMTGPDASAHELFKAADSAMYRAKRSGPGRVARASDPGTPSLQKT